MRDLYDSNAPKKPTNLSVNSDLLDKCRALNINLSATLEDALKQKLADQQGERWAKSQRRAIAAYNQLVEQEGIFGEEFRSF